MADRFAPFRDWYNTGSGIFSFKKFPPVFFDNLTMLSRHGGYAEINPSWHGENHIIQVTKIFYIIEGSGHLIVEGKHYDLTAGNFYITPEKHTHSFYIDKGCFVKKYWFHVNIRIGDDDYFSVADMPVCVKAKDPDKAKELCRRLSECMSRMRGFRNTNEIPVSILFEEKAGLAMLAGYISECVEGYNHAPNVSPGKNFGLVMEYIEKNICDNIKIEALAALVNMHPNYFVSKFKKIYSITPHRAILEKKIQKAKELLDGTNLSVSHIASYLGYNDIYYFSRQFKKITGVSPRQYKRGNL